MIDGKIMNYNKAKIRLSLSSWVGAYFPLLSCLIFSSGDCCVQMEGLRSVGPRQEHIRSLCHVWNGRCHGIVRERERKPWSSDPDPVPWLSTACRSFNLVDIAQSLTCQLSLAFTVTLIIQTRDSDSLQYVPCNNLPFIKGLTSYV